MSEEVLSLIVGQTSLFSCAQPNTIRFDIGAALQEQR